jgi:hypothetical protein
VRIRLWGSWVCTAVTVGLTGCSGAVAPGLLDGSFHVSDGSVTVDPQTLDFGDVVVQSTVTKTVTLGNLSGFDLTVVAQVSSSATSPFSADPAPFVLKAGGTKDFFASFTPSVSSGGSELMASLTFSPQGGAPVSVGLQGQAVQSGFQITPNPLDFNFVQPGQQLTLPLHLANVANQQIDLSSVIVAVAAGAFSMPQGPLGAMTLSPGGSLDVQVTFAPTGTPQAYVGELEIMSDDNLGVVDIPLQGYGGGAAISCTPTSLVFPDTAVGLTTTLPVLCTNSGTDVLLGFRQPDPQAELTLGGFGVSPAGSPFTAAIDSQWSKGPLTAGQSVQVDVSYSPRAAQTDSASLTVQSNDANPPAPPMLALSGKGVAEAKCVYSVSPATLAWGQLPLGYQPVTQTLTVHNLGPNECLVNDLVLQPGSAGFSLPNGPLASQRLSPPGMGGAFPTALAVPVAFTPSEPGSFSGVLGLEISDPDAPIVTVAISATAGNACLEVLPDEFNFGTVGIADGAPCSAGQKTFVVINGCPQDVTIKGTTVTSESNAFTLDSQTLPLKVAAGQTSAPFQVSFGPPAAGTYTGEGLMQTDLQQTPFGVYFQGSVAADNTWTDRFAGGSNFAVDILWVMDTAQLSERVSVGVTAQSFLNDLITDGIDFEMGVTSTDVCGAGESENGRLVPCPGCHIDGTQPTLVTAADPFAANDLETLMDLSYASSNCDGGPGDQFFEATYEAIVSGQGATYNSQNGFIRTGAALAVITVNGDDNDDDSTQETPQWYASAFLGVKGWDHPELFSWSYINPSQFGVAGGHQPFDRLPTRLDSMLNLVGGVALDSTQAAWSLGLSDLATALSSSTSAHEVYPLSGMPDPTSIQVYLDGPPPDQVVSGQSPGVPVSAGNSAGSWNWQYDATANTIELNTPVFSLALTDTLYVEYTLTCP